MMNYNNLISKILMYPVGILLSVLCITACADDPEIRKNVEEGETHLSLTLQNVALVSRAGDNIEDNIETLYVLGFEKHVETNICRYIFRREVNAKGENKFEINLPSADFPVKLLFVANYSDFSAINLNDSEDKIRSSLLLPFSEEGASIIPMFSEVEYTEGLPSGKSLDLTISLLRSMAKVSVALDEETDWNDLFELVSIQVYRANNQIQVIPDQTTMMEDELKVKAASVPDRAQHSIITPSLEEAGTNSFYLPESEPWGENKVTDNTCLIIGGKYLPEETNSKVTYYRVDFKGKDENQNVMLGHVLRNTHYKIAITEVEGPGSPHPEEAIDSGSASISTEITEWDINDEIRYGEAGSDDPLYFGLSGREVILPWYQGAANSVLIKTNVDNYRIVYYENEDNENGEIKASATKDGYIETEHFIIEHHYDSLVYITKGNNRTSVEYQEKIHIEVDLNINGEPTMVSKFVQIRQLPSDTYNKEYVSVYSMTGTLSNLGDEFLREYAIPDSAISYVFRNFFKNEDYFGPAREGSNVVVPFGGFTLGALQYESGLSYKKADLFEVIITPPYKEVDNRYVDDLSFEEVLSTWIDVKPNRVLLLYNQKKDIVEAFGRESENLGVTNGSNYRVSTNIPSYIVKGPFGDVTERAREGLTAPSVAIQAVWGLDIKNPKNAGIDPVLMYGDYIIVGIDPERRIIFLGDPYLFDPATPSEVHSNTSFFSNDGIIREDAYGQPFPSDVIFCNMVAWIAETVIGKQLAADQ